ncbi:MAG TPA: type 1 glutamine amidotransferase domain-containing protein [Polyangiaceae bacterium]|nr:type 1 glutamine amidotransferase domain-containing protein [Polyangiaceae bacterium]
MRPGKLGRSRWLPLFGVFLLGACARKPDAATSSRAPEGTPSATAASSRGRVLVVLSSSNQLPLKEGRSYRTGYFLNEVMVPVRALLTAHYEPVFATPAGTPAVMDPHSDSPQFFATEADYREIVELRHRLHDLSRTSALSAVLREGLEPYLALLVPGGHAAFGDLLENPELGRVLTHFHERHKPTALICHGPSALLSTLPRAGDFTAALANGDQAAAKAASVGFPYAGYRLTAFSTAEEQVVEEGGAGAFLGGKVRFYLDQALTAAGAQVEVREPFKSHVVVDRELISAQQPASDAAFTQALLDALQKSQPNGPVARD